MYFCPLHPSVASSVEKVGREEGVYLGFPYAFSFSWVCDISAGRIFLKIFKILFSEYNRFAVTFSRKESLKAKRSFRGTLAISTYAEKQRENQIWGRSSPNGRGMRCRYRRVMSSSVVCRGISPAGVTPRAPPPTWSPSLCPSHLQEQRGSLCSLPDLSISWPKNAG